MTTRISVETGSEYLLPFAKRKLAQLKEIGLQTCRVDASDGARIFIHNAEAISKGAVDTIRIFGNAYKAFFTVDGEVASAVAWTQFRAKGDTIDPTPFPNGEFMRLAVQRLLAAKRYDLVWVFCNSFFGYGSAYLRSGWDSATSGVGFLLVDSRYLSTWGVSDTSIADIVAPYLEQFEHTIPAWMEAEAPTGSLRGWWGYKTTAIPVLPGDSDAGSPVPNDSRTSYFVYSSLIEHRDMDGEILSFERVESHSYQNDPVMDPPGTRFTISTCDVDVGVTRRLWTRTSAGFVMTGEETLGKSLIDTRRIVFREDFNSVSPSNFDEVYPAVVDLPAVWQVPARYDTPGLGSQSTGTIAYKLTSYGVEVSPGLGVVPYILKPTRAVRDETWPGPDDTIIDKALGVPVYPPDHVSYEFVDRNGYKYRTHGSGLFEILNRDTDAVVYSEARPRAIPGVVQIGDAPIIATHSETRVFSIATLPPDHVLTTDRLIWTADLTLWALDWTPMRVRPLIMAPGLMFDHNTRAFNAVGYIPATGQVSLADWAPGGNQSVFLSAVDDYLADPTPETLAAVTAWFTDKVNLGFPRDFYAGHSASSEDIIVV